LQIATASYSGVTVLSADGRLDQDTASQFQDVLVKSVESAGQGGALVLDLGAVAYISSIGLRALMVASKKGKAGRVTIRLANVSSFVQEVLEVSRFDALFQSYPTVREALAACSPEAAAAYDAG